MIVMEATSIAEEAFRGLGYSIAGLFIGYMLGRFESAVEKIEEVIVSEHEHHEYRAPEQGPNDVRSGTGGQGGIGGVGGQGTPNGTGGQGGTGGPGGQGGSYTEHTGWQGRLLGIIVILLSFLTVSSTVYTNAQARNNAKHDKLVVACQAKFNQDFALAVTLRGQYADEDRQQLFQMIVAVVDVKLTPLQRKAAIDNWIAVSRKNEELRKATPLPNLDARNCGEVK
jgi:hypothetical protein